jgi:hypothetical protein
MMKIEVGSTAYAMPLAWPAVGGAFRDFAAKRAQPALGKGIEALIGTRREQTDLAAAHASLAQRNLDLTLGLGKAFQDYLA